MHISQHYGKNVNILLITCYLIGTLYGAISGHYSFVCVIGFMAVLTYTGVFISGVAAVVGLGAMFVLHDTLFLPFYLLVLLMYVIWAGVYAVAKVGEAVQG
jgi:hypothetical protein